MKRIFIILFTILFTSGIHAQLEKVIVETYYISDSIDAADTTNGILPTGSTTYRIYVDLQPGCKLNKVFGSAGHDFKISSTAPFFNAVYGETFGNKVAKTEISNGISALDTWLTLGQTYEKKQGKTGFGILKSQDKEPSSLITMLTNANPLAGTPLTSTDGHFSSAGLAPVTISHLGIVDEFTNYDSTIFGSILPGSEFNSKGQEVNLTAGSGVNVMGVVADSNQILIAQLTTKGKISFELNLEVVDPSGKLVTYVAKPDADPNSTAIVSSQLTYPGSCGCMDPHYLEYSNNFVCEKPQSCKTLIVCGCTDSFACNFDPNANVNIPALCCYPGFCNNRDIEVVCPTITSDVEFTVYPNPATFILMLQVSGLKENNEVKYSIYDSFGIFKMEGSKTSSTGGFTESIDVSTFSAGLYSIRVSVDGAVKSSKLFMKN